MLEDLLQLGFNKNEAMVYLTLVELGQSPAGAIIKKTSLHRNIVYETLDKLIAKKMVMEMTLKNIAVFSPTDPGRILEIQKEKLSVAEEIVPRLSSMANIKQEIVIYEGREGFQNFGINYVSRMKEGSTIYVLGAAGDLWYERMGVKYNRYERIRKQKKIVMKMVEYHVSKLDKQKSDNHEFYEVRVIPANLETPANVLILEDYIALQIFEEPMSVVEIKNASVAKAYLNYFNLLWAQGKEI
jgi:hypothetical protein